MSIEMLDKTVLPRDQYKRNMERLAALDRLLAALRAHQAHPCNIHWREVLAVLGEIPCPPITIEGLTDADRD